MSPALEQGPPIRHGAAPLLGIQKSRLASQEQSGVWLSIADALYSPLGFSGGTIKNNDLGLLTGSKGMLVV